MVKELRKKLDKSKILKNKSIYLFKDLDEEETEKFILTMLLIAYYGGSSTMVAYNTTQSAKYL